MAGAGKKQQQSEATRRRLIAASRRLFAARGYGGTSIDDILGRAGLTRGALYHHFRGKRDIFRLVFEQVEREVSEKVFAAAAAEPRADRRLATGCDAFLDACLDRDVQRISLLDAPSVLGWEAWREIGARHSLGSLEAALLAAMEEGQIERQPVEPLAQVLLGAFNHAALVIAQSDDVQAARAEVGRTLQAILKGLQPVA